MSRIRLEQSDEQVVVTIAPMIAARVLRVLIVLLNLGFAGALTDLSARLLRPGGESAPIVAILAVLLLTGLVWLGILVAVPQLLGTYRITLTPDLLTLERRLLGWSASRQQSVLGPSSAFIVPDKPRPLSLDALPAWVLALDDAPDVTISRDVLNLTQATILKAGFNEFLDSRRSTRAV